MNDEAPVPFKNYFPKLSISSYFWLVIFLSAIFFGIGGFFVGIRVNAIISSTSSPVSLSQITPTPGAGDDDANYSRIYGFFVSNTNYYQQFVISIDSDKNGVRTGLDTDFRYITKPQSDVSYPYSFDRLDPTKSYIISASACAVDPKTYALDCAKNIKIATCPGTIQGNNCIVKAAGIQSQASDEVNFSLTQPK